MVLFINHSCLSSEPKPFPTIQLNTLRGSRMTSQEAEQIMNPFYPHDPNLAMRAMGKALEGHIPEWILESVVGSYFTFLQMQEIHVRIMNLQMLNQDPFGLQTIPYRLNLDDGVELN